MSFRNSIDIDDKSDDGIRCDASLDNCMNPISNTIPDVQNTVDTRKISIQKVGVKGVKHPLRVHSRDGIQPSVGTWNMYVQLPDHQKGTHMSRFIDLLESFTSLDSEPLDFNVFTKLIHDMLTLLNAESGMIEVSFPFFMSKAAPISKVRSVMNYEVGMKGEIINGKLETTLSVQVPVTSLCPCSKEISKYGAHNQRSHISVVAVLNKILPIEELIANIEAQGSCELYGLLKRPDEKYVTEYAYENPKFVEDLVRDVAGMLNADDRIAAYSLEAENFESIHNHSAYASIEHDKRK